MTFFHGFSLQNEELLFKDLITENPFHITGLSYGAIKAFEYVLNTDSRVDKLTLISPAFFQIEDKKFKKLQLLSFRKNPKAYLENFIANCSYPSNFNLEPFTYLGEIQHLQELLEYEWSQEKLTTLTEKGVKIEVHVGEKDKIVNVNEVKKFFTSFAVVYTYKNKGHILQ